MSLIHWGTAARTTGRSPPPRFHFGLEKGTDRAGIRPTRIFRPSARLLVFFRPAFIPVTLHGGKVVELPNVPSSNRGRIRVTCKTGS
jgi:hypothetical protein